MVRKNIKVDAEIFDWLDDLREEKGMTWVKFMPKVKNWLVDYFRKEQAFSQGIAKSREIAKNEMGIEYQQLLAHNVDLQKKISDLNQILARKNEEIAKLEKQLVGKYEDD